MNYPCSECLIDTMCRRSCSNLEKYLWEIQHSYYVDIEVIKNHMRHLRNLCCIFQHEIPYISSSLVRTRTLYVKGEYPNDDNR
jgi:hypothetical protein